MSDLTVYAEALIAAVARAFYDDECIVIVDILIAQKFLRDDDMSQRLNLPAKKLRSTLQFLLQEHLVYSETVDDLAQGGSQATKFYYLDYNRAVHTIRLRLFLLRQQLEQAELRSRSNSFYLCPGYKLRRCNGRYTENEAQQVLDVDRGLFLCQECSLLYENNPQPPPIDTYTLQLVDNTKDLKLAMDNLRRLNVQLSSKYIGNNQMRPGIYDLLQKVRGGSNVKGGGGSTRAPITSNLPSENFALGIGSKRLAGTGRTAGIKAKKLEQQGVVVSAAQAKKYLVNSRDGGSGHDDLLFLKNALGHEIQFTVEKGGGARAQLLASKKRRAPRKLMDAAASRVGGSLPFYMRVEETRKRKLQQELDKQQQEDEDNNVKNKKNKRKLMKAGDTFHFLKDNIGRKVSEENNPASLYHGDHDGTHDETVDDASGDDPFSVEPELVALVDDTEEMRRQIPEETRMANFQAQYKLEMERQMQLLGDGGTSNDNKNNTMMMVGSSPSSSKSRVGVEDDDTTVGIDWEDGELL